MIYKDDYGDEIRIDVVRSLNGATSIELMITKPSGTILIRPATRYGSTNQITYTTIEGDTDEAGTYCLNARIKWGFDAKLTGDTVYLEVYEPGAISPSQVIAALPAYTFLDSVQSESEYVDGENTEAEVLYPQFSVLLKKAKTFLADDLEVKGITLEATDELACLCYLIARFILERDPNWSASSIAQPGGGSISRSSAGQGGGAISTDPQKSYENILTRAQNKAVGSGQLLDVVEEVFVMSDESDFQSVREGTFDPEA